jgi:hypothetical protein
MDTTPGCNADRDAVGRPHRPDILSIADAGCNTHEIAAVAGHASLKEVARHTEAADQKRLAQSAMPKVRTLSGKPDERFAKKG